MVEGTNEGTLYPLTDSVAKVPLLPLIPPPLVLVPPLAPPELLVELVLVRVLAAVVLVAVVLAVVLVVVVLVAVSLAVAPPGPCTLYIPMVGSARDARNCGK